MSLHETSLDSYSYFVKDITAVSGTDQFVKGKQHSGAKLCMIQFKMPHSVQPVTNSKTIVNSFLNKRTYEKWPLTYG